MALSELLERKDDLRFALSEGEKGKIERFEVLLIVVERFLKGNLSIETILRGLWLGGGLAEGSGGCLKEFKWRLKEFEWLKELDEVNEVLLLLSKDWLEALFWGGADLINWSNVGWIDLKLTGVDISFFNDLTDSEDKPEGKQQWFKVWTSDDVDDWDEELKNE